MSKLTLNYSLLAVNPALTSEWHPTRNGSLTPSDVTPHSHKKVWWLCKLNHEWQAVIHSRSYGTGCPYCSGRAVNNETCLTTINPLLAKEWHPTRNGSLTPSDVTPHSHKKVWWLCKLNHEWQAVIHSRSYGTGCPYCSGRVLTKDNCLQTINPALAKEWHPTKNGSLTPSDVGAYSNKKAWWSCNRGHAWEAIIGNRSKGSGCPYCHSSTSQLELATYCELKYLFNDAILRKKVYGKECDIFIPTLKLGIEIDGVFWHRNKLENDKSKYLFLNKKGINVINVRARELDRVSNSDVYFSPKDGTSVIIHRIVRKILEQVAVHSSLKKAVERYVKGKVLVNEAEYKRLLYMLPSPLREYSLQEQVPLLAKEWHPTKNGSLTPRDVTPFAHRKIWWLCARGHAWEAMISDRSMGNGCPYCSGRAVNAENCLSTLNPELAKEWHPTKNGNLTPSDVTPYSNKKAWWICNRGHAWEAAISGRSKGHGCLYCVGQLISKDNCLQTINPALAKEWHPTRNGSLTPNDVAPHSGKKVWWICERGHVWEATINHRSHGKGCPYCSGRKKQTS